MDRTFGSMVDFVLWEFEIVVTISYREIDIPVVAIQNTASLSIGFFSQPAIVVFSGVRLLLNIPYGVFHESKINNIRPHNYEWGQLFNRVGKARV